MFPHHRLDYHLSHLERALDAAPDDSATQLDLAEHCLSKAMYHGGGEPWYNRALTHAKRVTHLDPSLTGAKVVAGIALVGLQRFEPASSYLQQALAEDAERADVHFGLGLMHEREGAIREALHHLTTACRLAPESFEIHHRLAFVLWALARRANVPKRLLERSQYHTIEALRLEPTPEVETELRFHLAMTALHTRRWAEADALLHPLLDTPRFASRVRYFLGITSYHLGKHKNAIVYLKQFLRDEPESARGLAKLGLAYLQLGEYTNARACCNRALAIDPHHAEARWVLGCALVEEGQRDDAVQVFRALLEEEPDHLPAYTERIRLHAHDLRWLTQALRAEVASFDQLPLHHVFAGPQGPRSLEPRTYTRRRIDVIIDAMREHPEAVSTLLGAMVLTTDEGLRFTLWEAALAMVREAAAERILEHLQAAGERYDPAVARELLAVVDPIPEEQLMRGLDIQEEDLDRAAVARHGPAANLKLHRQHIEEERELARAWQALLLLALGAKGGERTKNLLIRWEAEADRELQIAAMIARVLHGDEPDRLRNEARRFRVEPTLDALLAGRDTPSTVVTPTPLADDSPTPCSTCGRRAQDAGHLLGGAEAAICDRCMYTIALRRHELVERDPSLTCALCHRPNTGPESIFRHQGIAVCSSCLDVGLGLTEREAVDRYFDELLR